MLRRIRIVSRCALLGFGLIWLLLLFLNLVIRGWYTQTSDNGSYFDVGVVGGTLNINVTIVNVTIDGIEYVPGPDSPSETEWAETEWVETGFVFERNEPFVPPWLSPLPTFGREVYSFGQYLTVSIPLWLLAVLCLAWPVTSFVIARRRRGTRGFEVEVGAAGSTPLPPGEVTAAVAAATRADGEGSR